MINYDLIRSKVRKIKSKYSDSHNMKKIADSMDIEIRELDMGKNDSSIKAMSCIISRIPIIILNENLSDIAKNFITAHELGHIVLHSDQLKEPVTEISFFDAMRSLENEANLFASELMIEDEEMLELLSYESKTIFQISSILNVPYELCAYKIKMMQTGGFKVASLPYEPESDFLKQNMFSST